MPLGIILSVGFALKLIPFQKYLLDVVKYLLASCQKDIFFSKIIQVNNWFNNNNNKSIFNTKNNT